MIKINCDLCGKTEDNLNRAVVEDVELHVCASCSKFGKVLGPVKRLAQKKLKPILQEKQERIDMIVEGYADIIKKRRESMGLTQKDFAKRLSEKESTVHKVETGILQPSLLLAKKLQKLLKVKLIEEYEELHESIKKKKDDGFTLGDFIKTKK